MSYKIDTIKCTFENPELEQKYLDDKWTKVSSFYFKVIIFFILYGISAISEAQTLKAFLYTANFNSPENKSYIETYLSFDVNSVHLIEDENNKFSVKL